MIPNCAADERHNGGVIHASVATSIPNLKCQEIAVIQGRVDKGDLDELPPILSEEWICLQFLPNVYMTATAAMFTGRLKMKRVIKTHTLWKEHINQHFVNAMTRYYIEWIVELCKTYPGIEFFG